MKKFEVTIEEVISQTFELQAENLEQAIDLAMEKYGNGEFVLEPGELESKTMMVKDTETEEETNWFDF